MTFWPKKKRKERKERKKRKSHMMANCREIFNVVSGGWQIVLKIESFRTLFFFFLILIFGIDDCLNYHYFLFLFLFLRFWILRTSFILKIFWVFRNIFEIAILLSSFFVLFSFLSHQSTPHCNLHRILRFLHVIYYMGFLTKWGKIKGN